MASPPSATGSSTDSSCITPKGKKNRSAAVEEQLGALVKELHRAFDTNASTDPSTHDAMTNKRADLQKQKAALGREMRNDKRRTARMKEKTKLLSENDLIEAWSLRYAKNSTPSETGGKKRKSPA